MANDQRTLKSVVTLSGAGLHSGDICEVTIRPADVDSGIVFVRDGRSVPGVVGSVVSSTRGTTVGCNGSEIMTVEHLMAALRGSGVDNAVVEVRGSETPALDGSSRPFVDAIREAGTEIQGRPRRTYRLRKRVCIEANGGCILASPSESLKISYTLKYDHPMIGAQTATFEFDEGAFRDEIAPARTFVLYEEVADLLADRLAQGGSLSNTIVVWRDHLSSDLRFSDEFARHKILDIVGDLALIGGELRADIVAVKSGHALNIQLARKVSEIADCDEGEG